MLMPLLVLIMVVPSAMMVMFGTMDLTQRFTTLEYAILREIPVKSNTCNYLVAATTNVSTSNMTYVIEKVTCGLFNINTTITGCYASFPAEGLHFGKECKSNMLKGIVLVSVGSIWFISMLSCVLYCTNVQREPDINPNYPPQLFAPVYNTQHYSQTEMEDHTRITQNIQMNTVDLAPNHKNNVQLAKTTDNSKHIIVVVNP
jgi:hypothetical protein